MQNLWCNVSSYVARSFLFQLMALEKRLCNNKSLYEKYNDFLSKYQMFNHMKFLGKIIDACFSNYTDQYYIPHNGVIQHATKLRVVFNASARCSNSNSLNSSLLTGPSFQSYIVNILIRRRMCPFAYHADIEKMYRPMTMNSDDRKIIWRCSVGLSIYKVASSVGC